MAFKRVFSPSQVGTYDLCPRQYQAKYITKEVKFVQNKYAAFGDTVHKQIEDFLNDGKPVDRSLQPLADVLSKHAGKLVCAEIALGRSDKGASVGQYDKTAYINSKIDAVYTNADETVIMGLDWKTGKAKEARIQSDMNAAVLAAKYKGTAKKIIMVFVHLYHDKVYVTEYNTEQLAIAHTFGTILNLDMAIRENNFPPKPNGLCKKWCDVVKCPHNGRSK